MRFIDSATVRSALSVGRATYVLREAILDGADPAADALRGAADVPNGQLLTMPSGDARHAGCKVLSVHRGNPDRGLPAIQGVYVLFDGDTLAPVAVLDGAAITDIRTPALSYAGILDIVRRRHASRADAPSDRDRPPLRVAVIGAGPQAVHHAAGAVELFGDADITFVVRTDREIDWDGRHSVSDTIPADADLIICATSAADPVLADGDVADHAVIVAMGAHDPAKREVPGPLMGRSRVLVEDEEVARAECGDVVLAVREGELSDGDWATLRDVVRDRALSDAIADSGRPVVFKTAGQGWEDLAVAAEVLARVGD